MDEKDYDRRATEVVDAIEKLVKAIVAGGPNPDPEHGMLIGLARNMVTELLADTLHQVGGVR
jgi:hypothetical protein